MALHSAMERIVTAYGRQRKLVTLPFAFGGLGVYFRGDVLNSAFLAPQLEFVGLQTKLLRHVGIVA